jgi:chromosomal replication initiator protein
LDLPAQPELAAAWRDIRADLQRTVGESTYAIWFSQLEAEAWDGGVLVLKAPQDKRGWILGRFRRVLERSVRSVLGPAARIEFDDGSAAHRLRGRHETLTVSELSPDDFNPRHSFEQFIIGDGNRMAHAAALTAAELPGQGYNPLFLYSSPGLGKTHLLHAIGNYVLAFGAGTTVRYATVETFTNQFIGALNSKKSLEHFKHAYRDADVLLIDDVQFFASKTKTEEEFFHTFNALYETGRQLVLTCDRLPRQLLDIGERLRERFGSGLVAEIYPPDIATRVAILRKRALLDGIVLHNSNVLELIAARVTTNIRTLEGALIQIVAYASLAESPVDVEIATTVLDRLHPPTRSTGISVDRIQALVAERYGLSVTELVSDSRTARIAWPRQIAIHLAKQLTMDSLQQIGTAFGGRNHATVLHACKRVSARLLDDREAADSVRDLEDALKPSEPDRRS